MVTADPQPNGADTGFLFPDPTVIRAHLDRLFGRCLIEYPDGLCEIAWSDAHQWAIKNAQSFPVTPEGLAEAAALAVVLNGTGSNIYVGVNPRKPGAPERGRCSAEHVEVAFFQFCECDKAASLDLVRCSPLPFSLFVVTGRTPTVRVHGYHELQTPVRDMSLWRRRQEAERDHYSGDNVVDPPRIMRLAGTVNFPPPHKAARGYRPELVEFHGTKAAPVSDEDFDFGGFGDNGAEQPHAAGSADEERPNFEADDTIADCLAKIDADDHWHDNCRDLIGKLVSEGYDRRIILALAPRLTRPGYAINQTIIEIKEFIRGAEAKFGGTPESDEKFNTEIPPLWIDVPLSSWSERTIEPRPWVWEDWVPLGQCVGLYGVPGARKTDWLLQFLMATSMGLPFCGTSLAHMTTYGLFCEDDEEEIVRRAQRIAGFYGRSLSEFTGFRYASLVGVVDTEFVTFGPGGKMTTRPAYELFRQRIAEHQAGLAVLDTAPDFFGGDEIKRRQVSQFLRLLDATAAQSRCSILFSAHPSKTGISTGQFDSGSTAWEGKVRARLTMHDPVEEDCDATISRPMSNKRVLTRAKSNYAAQGEQLQLVFEDGGFKAVGLGLGGSKGGVMRDLAANAKFLELLEKVKATGAYVGNSINHPSHYAPAVFSKHPRRGGFSRAEFERAMGRLLDDGRVRLAERGTGRRAHMELTIV